MNIWKERETTGCYFSFEKKKKILNKFLCQSFMAKCYLKLCIKGLGEIFNDDWRKHLSDKKKM